MSLSSSILLLLNCFIVFSSFSDIVFSGKVLTRRYIPVVSSEDYASENINGVLKDLLSSNILLQYVESENDIQVIERLQEKLEERKKALERKS